MSADIQKEALFDSRIIQSRPRYGVFKGPLSLSNAPFQAIAATSSQLTFNVYVPSENVFVDRKIDWTGQVRMSVDVTMPGGTPAGTPIFVPGRDGALCAFPMNSMASTVSTTINDTTSVLNTQDVLKEVLRMTDYSRNRLQRTCPTMLDKYQSYDDAFEAINNPNASYESSASSKEVGNGAYPGFQFSDSTGTTIYDAYDGTVAVPIAIPAYAGGGAYAGYNIVSGMPLTAVNLAVPTTYKVYYVITSTEPIVLSPYVFADSHEWDVGLFGCNNIQLIFNLQSNVSRTLRTTTRTGKVFANIGFNPNANASPWGLARLNVQFLTPSLDVPLPPKSCVNYTEFPRYISNPTTQAIQAGRTATLLSQTITLPAIPELLIIFVKATAATTAGVITGGVPASNLADFYLPLANLQNSNVANPLSVNFDNFSGLLSSHTTEQLYAMCVKNGLEMDWAEWSGHFHAAISPYALSPVPVPGNLDAGQLVRQRGQSVPSVGSILVLKPGQDITLQPGQAGSLVGNFSLQYSLQVFNNSSYAVTPTIYTITVNSGFLETVRGSSRIIKGILSEQDIISAPVAAEGTRTGLERCIGGFSFSSLGNVLSRAKKVYEASKPAIGAVRSAIDAAPGIMDAVRGRGTGAGTGAGTGGRKSLGMRLM